MGMRLQFGGGGVVSSLLEFCNWFIFAFLLPCILSLVPLLKCSKKPHVFWYLPIIVPQFVGLPVSELEEKLTQLKAKNQPVGDVLKQLIFGLCSEEVTFDTAVFCIATVWVLYLNGW